MGWSTPRTGQLRKRRSGMLVRLEERIVLDAAGPDGGDESTEPVESGTDGLTAPAGQVDFADTDSVGEATANGAVKVLLVSSEADNAEDLAAAAVNDVLTLVYDGRTTEAEALLGQVATALDGRMADSVAIAAHGNDAGSIHLADNLVIDAAGLDDPAIQSFWQGLAGYIADDGRIDLLSCDVAAGADGIALVESLETLTGRDVTASDDTTGNAASGGDWWLETDGIDAASVYFNAELLAAYSGTLAGSPPSNLGLLDLSPTDLQTTLTELANGSGAAADRFGVSVDIDGDRMIIGEEAGGAGNEGRAYIYEWDGSSWGLMATGTLNSGAAGDRFGYSVAIDGDLAAVGEGDHGVGEQVHIYRWGGAAWGFEQTLDGEVGDDDGFGEAIAFDNGWLVVGAPDDADNGSVGGSVGFYYYNGAFWQLDGFTKELNPDDQAGDRFGASVDIDGNWAFVGTPGDAGNTGAVHAFFYNGAAWVVDPKITASDAAAGGEFGSAVAVDGLRAVVGASGQDGSGAAYVFDRGGSWSQSAKLSPSDGALNDGFGSSVAIDNDLIVVGAPLADPGGVANAGAVYAFVNDGGWTEAGTVISASPTTGAAFGSAVDAWLDQGFVGDPGAGKGALAIMQTEPEVAENSAAGTVVGRLTGFDPEGDGLSYTLTDDAGGRFALSGTKTIIVASGASLDFESAAAHTITVRASDGTGTYDESFTIHLADVTEATPPGTPITEPEPVTPPEDTPPTAPVEDDGGAEDAGDESAEGTDDAGLDLATDAQSFEQFLNEQNSVAGLAGIVAMPAGTTAEEREDPTRSEEEQDRWTLEEGDTDLLQSITDLALREDVLFDPSQPIEIRQAFDSILQAYTTSSAEIAAYLQSAFRSVAESAVMHKRSTEVLESAQAEMDALVEAGWPVEEELRPLLAMLQESREAVIEATRELRSAVVASAAAGEVGFDRSFEDVVTGAVAGLSQANEHLIGTSQTVESVVRELRARRLEGMEPPGAGDVKAEIQDIREKVAKELGNLHRRWDLASEDVFAAFIKRLVVERKKVENDSVRETR